MQVKVEARQVHFAQLYNQIICFKEFPEHNLYASGNSNNVP